MKKLTCLKVFLVVLFLLQILLSLLVMTGSIILVIFRNGLFILIVSVPCLVTALFGLILSAVSGILIGKSAKWIKKAGFRLRRKRTYLSLIILEVLNLIIHIFSLMATISYLIWAILEIVQFEENLKNSTVTNIFYRELENESIRLLSNLGGVGVFLAVWLLVRFCSVPALTYWLSMVRKNKDIIAEMSQLDYSIKNYKDLVEETEIGSVDVDREDWEDTFDNFGQDVYACNNKAV